MEQCRMHVMVADPLIFGLISDFIAGADLLAALNSSTRHEDCHRARVVIASHTAL